MQSFLVENSNSSSVNEFILRTSESADEIRLAVAYFSHSDLIDRWLQRKLRLSFVVALQPPTSPDLLRRLLHAGLEIKFYDSRFHSKLYLFYRSGQPFGALVGSANFTAGGLLNNIETNVFLSDSSQLDALARHFQSVWDAAASLSPPDVQRYRQFCRETQQEREKINSGYAKFERQNVAPRFGRGRKRVTSKEGRDYLAFWKRVDEVKEIVGQISETEYPGTPSYLVIDHFWHWIVKIWNQKNLQKIAAEANYRREILPVLFRQFIEYDKGGENYNGSLNDRAEFFRSVLSPERIQELSREDARQIYSRMHSGRARSQRFDADEKFTKENSLEKIRTSLEYLLCSQDDVAQRISALLVDDAFKLKQFGSSNVQELIGWVLPDHPIRNEKANKAVEMLGFHFR
ncbi:MAG: phospholipase D family protein [Verrucomicrobia bacterium]|nr:phospholipase D family protein [Verrucomicrobiota bacterium]